MLDSGGGQLQVEHQEARLDRVKLEGIRTKN